MIINAKLSKQGYIIPKSDLTTEQIEEIENELTIEPEVDQRYKTTSDNDIFNIYLETVARDKIVVPRYYGINKFGIPEDHNIKFNKNEFDKCDLNFQGNLRDYQNEIMDTILQEYCTDIDNPKESLKKFGGSIISIPP